MPDFSIVRSNHAPFRLQWTRIWKQYAIYDPDIPVTLTYGQGHQAWYELVDPKEVFSHAKFERFPLNNIRQKANVTFLSNQNLENMSNLSWEYKSEK